MAPTTDDQRLKDIKNFFRFFISSDCNNWRKIKVSDENTVKNFIDKIKKISNIPICNWLWNKKKDAKN